MILTCENRFFRVSTIAFLLFILINFSVKGQPAEKEDGDTVFKSFTLPSGDGASIKFTKIWDQEPHNAFTDLIRFNDQFFVTFRSAGKHVPRQSSEDGKIRVLTSADGEIWEPFALHELEGYDLRDPKLSITPEGRLMLHMGGSVYENGKLIQKLNHVSFLNSSTGTFSTPQPLRYAPELQSNQNWLWTITWHKDIAYGVIYRGGKVFLVKSSDGLYYELITPLNIDHFPNESKVVFLPNDEMMIIVRRDDKKLQPAQRTGVLGTSQPPYTNWHWNTMDLRLGGPHLIPLQDDQWLLGTRAFHAEHPKATTTLFSMDTSGKTKKLIDLPSGGDTSYPGMVIHDDKLWVSYYSSHEGKTSIYMAQIPMEMVRR